MKSYVFLAAVVLTGILPFSSRAVFMDEHLFLQLARSAQSNWLFPADTPGIFFGTPVPNFASHTHPPVGEYYLAILYAAIGEFREAPFRLLFAVFPVTAVLGFYTLARRFTQHPLLVALLFAASPAFFVMSPTLMMDIPMLAFLLAGTALYFEHVQGRRGFLPAAATCFVLALGTGYTAIIPLGCLFIGMLAAGRPKKELLGVAAAPMVLALWLVMMTFHFGEFPLTETVKYYTGQHSSFHNAIATFSFLGGVAVFPWAVAVSRRLFIVSIGLATAMSVFVSTPSVPYRIWFIVLAAFGVALLASFAKSCQELIAARKNSGEAFLILWVPATLVFFVVVADLISARYLLLAFPALYLLLFRRSSIRHLTVALIPTAALSLSLAYADLVFVNSYRTWASETVVTLQRQGFRLWHAAESGLRFNLERLGVAGLSAVDIRPTGPDLVVQQYMYRYSLAAPVATMLTVLKTFETNDSFPVRTYNFAAGAGFHDSNMGMVPFVISKAPFDRLEIAQISPFADRLPLPQNNPAWSPAGVVFRQSEPERVFPMRVPSQTTLEYEIESGGGTAEITSTGIRLKKSGEPSVVWKLFRIVPMQFRKEKD